MDMQQRRTAFSRRFNSALQNSGKAGLSDGEIVKLLARKGVGVTSQSVSNWRNGKHLPRLEQFEGVAEMLGVDVGELAFGKPRAAEPGMVYRAAGGEQALLECMALLGDDARQVLRQLNALLATRGEKPGRRKATHRR